MPTVPARSQFEGATGRDDELYRQRGLWGAAFGGATAWFLDLCVRYFLVEAGWAQTRELRVAAVGGLALLCALAALIACVRKARRLHRPDGNAPGFFVATCGIGLNALFALLIAATLSMHLLLSGGPLR
jgi:hypothetical protein